MHVSQVSTSTRGSLCTSDGGAAAVVRSNTSQAGNITIVRPYVRTVHSNNSKVGRGEQTQETSQQAMHPPTHRMNVTQTARNSDKQSRHARTSRTNEQQQRTNERTPKDANAGTRNPFPSPPFVVVSCCALDCFPSQLLCPQKNNKIAQSNAQCSSLILTHLLQLLSPLKKSSFGGNEDLHASDKHATDDAIPP